MNGFDVSKTRKNRSAAVLEEKIELYSRVPHYVLITGERGTGKTTIAKTLHKKGARSKKTFVNLNCASLTKELLEAELFGYEKGSFTGASTPKAGLFEVANGGTLFLDEIGEIPLNLQAKLLKAVDEKQIRRVGSNIERKVDARIIAATSQNLAQMVSDRTFRADLFDRLNILNLETVPLRYQKGKIRALIEQGLDTERTVVGRRTSFKISEQAITLLENCDWFGNYRELLNFATRLAVECLDESEISEASVKRVMGEKIICSISKQSLRAPQRPEEQIPADIRVRSANQITVVFDPKNDDLKDIYLKAAGNVIQHILSENDYSLRRAARKMGTTHSTLSRIMKQFYSLNKSEDYLTLPPNARHYSAAA